MALCTRRRKLGICVGSRTFFTRRSMSSPYTPSALGFARATRVLPPVVCQAFVSALFIVGLCLWPFVAGRLVLVDVPSRRELASKNVYNVKGAAMHWQGSGDFLCLRTVVVKKTGKKGRKEFTQLEIFRMREKDIPVDNLRLNDVALQLHWEEGAGEKLRSRLVLFFPLFLFHRGVAARTRRATRLFRECLCDSQGSALCSSCKKKGRPTRTCASSASSTATSRVRRCCPGWFKARSSFLPELLRFCGRA